MDSRLDKLCLRMKGAARVSLACIALGAATATVVLVGCSASASIDTSPGVSDPVKVEVKTKRPAGDVTTARPKLMLFLVADQFPAEYLERFDGLLDGGLRRLQDTGVHFTRFHLEHANTLTATGHASMITGLQPRRHGIVGNYWYDRTTGERVYCVEDEDEEDSPLRNLGTTLGDWLRQTVPDARIYTVSGKDRAAILLGGRVADGAFWYDKGTGELETSDFYPAEADALVQDFNAKRLLRRHFATIWEPLPVEPEQLAAAGISSPDLGPLTPGFPHPLTKPAQTPGLGFYHEIAYSPLLDDHLAEFARHLIRDRKLGDDDATDLLAISFSSLDWVGHTYGPQSREVLDVVLRLDRTLDAFLSWVDDEIGLENVLVTFTSDHGVVATPEASAETGLPGSRTDEAGIRCFAAAQERISERLGGIRWLLPGPLVDEEAVREAGHSPDAALEWLAAELEACPNVRKIWTRSRVLSATTEDRDARLFFNAYHSHRSPDYLVQFEPYHLWTQTTAASHWSPYDYDTHVPFIIRLPKGEQKLIETQVGMVDVAPTLAALLGIDPPADLDGTDRSALLRP